MSSLAASRADNFYFPPDWRPEYGGISKFNGSTGANQFEKYGIMRFELPFDGWCLKCERHMCKGLRFNAKKDAAGKYFSTTIWAFTMKCYSCDQKFVIKTDPAGDTYDFAEGLRKMEIDFVPDANDSIIEATTDEKRLQLQTNAMFRLQHEQEDKVKVLTAADRLQALTELRDADYKHDYDANSVLRNINRRRKHADKARVEEGRKRGLPCQLLDEDPVDAEAAKRVKFHAHKHSAFAASEKRKIIDIHSESSPSGARQGHRSPTDRATSVKTLTSRNIEMCSLKLKSELRPAIAPPQIRTIKSLKRHVSDQDAAILGSTSISREAATSTPSTVTETYSTPCTTATVVTVSGSSATATVATSTALSALGAYSDED